MDILNEVSTAQGPLSSPVGECSRRCLPTDALFAVHNGAMPDLQHQFNDVNPLAERNTRRVVWLTAIMMILEIVAGWLFHSMALLADGWHMSSHVVALGLAAAAYSFARRFAQDQRFAFGTWKIEVLGGYTSALLLVAIAIYMAVESITRLGTPVAIQFDQALGVAVLGLGVNLYSAFLLSRGEHSSQAHMHQHAQMHQHSADDSHHHHSHDLNLRAAYVHVLADAATSLLAIGALLVGKFLGAAWMDPVTGIVGSIVVALWALSLLRSTGKALLDAEMDAPVVAEIRECLRAAPAELELTDLHVWRVGKGKFACALSVCTDASVSAEQVRQWLSVHKELIHLTVEIQRR